MNTPDENQNDNDDGEPQRGSPEEPPFHSPVSPDDGDDNGNATAAENTNIQRIVELLPPQERAALFGFIRRESMSHSGWLPTPDFMRQYDVVLPGLAERIVAMPENEQAFRHKTTGDIVDRDYRLRNKGQTLGIVALVLILSFCVLLALLGGLTAAASVAGVTIVGTVGVFATGQLAANKSTSKDLIEGDDEAGS